MIVRSRFNRAATIPAPIGDCIMRKFEEVFEHGKRVISVASESSLVDLVNEGFADSLIYNILARYERGDVTALSQTHGQYMDVVGMPRTLAEAQQLLIKVRNDFDNMPIDVRRKFNNSVDEFVESVSTGDAREIFKNLFATEAPTEQPSDPNSDVKE